MNFECLSLSGFGSTGKPKKFQCSVCNKAYVGQGSLERHYRSHPDHAPEGMQFTTPVSSKSFLLQNERCLISPI